MIRRKADSSVEWRQRGAREEGLSPAITVLHVAAEPKHVTSVGAQIGRYLGDFPSPRWTWFGGVISPLLPFWVVRSAAAPPAHTVSMHQSLVCSSVLNDCVGPSSIESHRLVADKRTLAAAVLRVDRSSSAWWWCFSRQRASHISRHCISPIQRIALFFCFKRNEVAMVA